MERGAYEQYQSEIGNWLKQGRIRLLRAMLAEIGDPGRTLELLEVGAGVGQNLPVLAERAFGSTPAGSYAAGKILQIGTPRDIYDRPIPFDLRRTYDVIVAFDVLEHIADDREAAAWICDRLAPGGHLIASVPAYQWLFSDHDVALQHFRRYTRARLVAALPAGMTVRRSGYFVSLLFPLAAASRLAGKLARRLRGPGEAARKQAAAVPGPLDRLFRGLLDI